jgi:hypothetical protein
MAASRQVQIGSLAVTVRELTVGEVRDWLASVESGQTLVDAAGEYVFEDASVQELARMCDLPVSGFDAFTPSEIEPIRQAARDLNPHFFGLRAAVAAAQKSIVRRLLSPDQSSETPSR